MAKINVVFLDLFQTVQTRSRGFLQSEFFSSQKMLISGKQCSFPKLYFFRLSRTMPIRLWFLNDLVLLFEVKGKKSQRHTMGMVRRHKSYISMVRNLKNILKYNVLSSNFGDCLKLLIVI